MTNDFEKGLIMGLAMHPLQVTTEHVEPDPAKEEAVPFIRAFTQLGGKINMIRVIGVQSTNE